MFPLVYAFGGILAARTPNLLRGRRKSERISRKFPGPLILRGTAARLMPIKLLGEERLAVRLHTSHQAATAAAEAAKWDEHKRVWVRLDVCGWGGRKVGLIIRALPFPQRKLWSEWEKEFAVQTAQKFGRGAGAQQHDG